MSAARRRADAVASTASGRAPHASFRVDLDGPAPPVAPARLYVVAAWVPRAETIAVGALGPVRFSRGWHAYVGSARRARDARVARHSRAAKPLRWHADYLFARHPATRAWVIDVPRRPDFDPPEECALVEALLAGAPTAGPQSARPATSPGGSRARPAHPRRAGLAAAPGPGAGPLPPRRACPGFGSSDCGCGGHLLRVPGPSRLEPALTAVVRQLGGHVAVWRSHRSMRPCPLRPVPLSGRQGRQ